MMSLPAAAWCSAWLRCSARRQVQAQCLTTILLLLHSSHGTDAVHVARCRVQCSEPEDIFN